MKTLLLKARDVVYTSNVTAKRSSSLAEMLDIVRTVGQPAQIYRKAANGERKAIGSYCPKEGVVWNAL